MNKMLSAVFTIVAVLVIVTVANVIVKQFSQHYKTETALLSNGVVSEQVQGVFIRDEQVISYDKGGVISYEVPDGGRIGADGVIANVYSTEEQIAVEQKIDSLQNELLLLERISNPGTTQTAQPSNIAELFTQNYKEYLLDREKHNLSAVSSVREEMLVLLSTYQLITGKDASYEEQMREIRSEIAYLKATKGDPLDVITAKSAAYFVSYADGYESELTLSSVGSLTTAQIQAVHDNNISQQNLEIIGKLIDSYQWVLVAVVDNSDKKYQQGTGITLKFASTSETVSGIITSLNASEGDTKTIIGITCEAMTHDLVQHRTENVELILREYQGIYVPRSALHFNSLTEEIEDKETGKFTQVTTRYRGVFILDGEQPEFRKLDVIYEGPDYVISAQRTEKSYLALYDSIITKGIDADAE